MISFPSSEEVVSDQAVVSVEYDCARRTERGARLAVVVPAQQQLRRAGPGLRGGQHHAVGGAGDAAVGALHAELRRSVQEKVVVRLVADRSPCRTR